MVDKTINLAIDAMGGDNAPFEIIKGAVLSIQNNNKINILLVGDEIQIKNSLSQLGPEALESIETNRITIIPSEGVIKDGDQPVIALKKNPKASIVISAYLVKNGQADGLISMGSTGASMAACALTMGIIKGIERPTVGGPIIGNSPNTVVLDIGANIDCKPSQLVTFAVLGTVYAKLTFNISNPRIGILNVGSEEGKGNKLIRDTYDLLKNTNLNFIGNIEPQDLFHNKAEVVVCDGYVGNILLKILESSGDLIEHFLYEELQNKISEDLLNVISTKAINLFNVGETYGVAPLFGVNGIAALGHGKASHKTIINAIKSIIIWIENDLINEMNKELKNYKINNNNE